MKECRITGIKMFGIFNKRSEVLPAFQRTDPVVSYHYAYVSDFKTMNVFILQIAKCKTLTPFDFRLTIYQFPNQCIIIRSQSAISVECAYKYYG
jgi:hypothetical protein